MLLSTVLQSLTLLSACKKPDEAALKRQATAAEVLFAFYSGPDFVDIICGEKISTEANHCFVAKEPKELAEHLVVKAKKSDICDFAPIPYTDHLRVNADNPLLSVGGVINSAADSFAKINALMAAAGVSPQDLPGSCDDGCSALRTAFKCQP
jgi:hypothetical protein